MASITTAFDNNPWLLPALFFAIGIALGLIVEYVVLPITLRIAKKTSWEFDDLVLGSFRGLPLTWFTCAGLHFALHVLPKWEVAGSAAEIAKRSYVIDTGDNILKIIIILSITLLVMRLAVGWMQYYGKKTGSGGQGVSLFSNIVRAIILILGFLTILQAFNKPITPILTALGVGGLAVALALQDTLSNLFAGLHILASRQIRQGDYVKLDSGDEGYVVDVAWRNTTIRALPNNMVIVPNSKLASAIITNFYQPEREMGMGISVCVGYDNDLEKVERVTLEVATNVFKRVPGLVESSVPAVRFGGFTDFGITCSVGFRVKEFTDQYLVKHEFVKALHARYKQENIEIPLPMRPIDTRKKA